MRAFFGNVLVKRSGSSDNLLLFLVAAATSVLLTRFYLGLFDYPQIVHGSIHLAHALFGGLLLSIANILIFSFHGKRVRQWSAVIAGVGFGQFIDEVGKLITRTNNYFYQPVPMIIYLSFIFLFFLYRYFDEYTPKTPKELIYDILEHLEDAAEHTLYQKTKKKIESEIQNLLTHPDVGYHVLVNGLHQLVEKLPTVPKKNNRYIQRVKTSWKWLEDFTAERKSIFYFLLLLFSIYIVNTFFGVYLFGQEVFRHEVFLQSHTFSAEFQWFMIVAQIASQAISAIVMTQGFLFLVGRKRVTALKLFRTGLAINILITHVFTLYFRQFDAVPELLITLGLFAIIHNILEEERS